MATRSRIGIELQDGSILSAYHHWDGYPSWLGRILETHYNTKEKVSSLIDGGDMSSAWTNVGWQNETRPESGPMYYSERGENCPPSLMTMNEYLDKNNNEEYAYIFRNNEWVCYDMNEFNDKDPEVTDIPEGRLMA
jgi:hypothetical protein